MNLITGFFKSPFEKLFNVSALKVDKDPFFSSTGKVRFKFNGTLDNKPVCVCVFEPCEAVKKVLLSKHTSMLSPLAFKTAEINISCTDFTIKGNYSCAVLSSFQPVLWSKMHEFDSLLLLKSAAEALEFIYNTLELQLSTIDDESLSTVQTSFVFTGFDALADEGLTAAKAIKQLVTLVNRKTGQQLEAKQQSPEQFLGSYLFESPVFRVMAELDEPGKLTDQLYIKYLLTAMDHLGVEQIFQLIVQKALAYCNKNRAFVETLFPVFITAFNSALKQRKAHTVTFYFNEAFEFVVNVVLSDPKTFISYFMNLSELKTLPESAAAHLARLAMFFLAKNPLQTQFRELAAVTSYFCRQLAQNTVLLTRSVSLEELVRAMGAQIAAYTSQADTMISWNCFLTVSNLLSYHLEFRQRNIDVSDTKQFVGLAPSVIWKSTLPQAATKAISQGNYDFIQAAYLFSVVLPTTTQDAIAVGVDEGWVATILEALHSKKCIFQGMLSQNEKQRTMVRELVARLLTIGMEAQGCEVYPKPVEEAPAKKAEEAHHVQPVKKAEEVKKVQYVEEKKLKADVPKKTDWSDEEEEEKPAAKPAQQKAQAKAEPVKKAVESDSDEDFKSAKVVKKPKKYFEDSEEERENAKQTKPVEPVKVTKEARKQAPEPVAKVAEKVQEAPKPVQKYEKPKNEDSDDDFKPPKLEDSEEEVYKPKIYKPVYKEEPKPQKAKPKAPAKEDSDDDWKPAKVKDSDEEEFPKAKVTKFGKK